MKKYGEAAHVSYVICYLKFVTRLEVVLSEQERRCCPTRSVRQMEVVVHCLILATLITRISPVAPGKFVITSRIGHPIQFHNAISAITISDKH